MTDPNFSQKNGVDPENKGLTWLEPTWFQKSGLEWRIQIFPQKKEADPENKGLNKVDPENKGLNGSVRAEARLWAAPL